MSEPDDPGLQPPDRPRGELSLLHLLPNLVTLLAICAGMTAIRFGFERDFERAVQLVLVAGVLDGVDGRLARLLRSQSPVGAELDSLADFLNFGVAPGLILHAWALQDMRSAGWIAVLCYAICCVIRLAKFNVAGRGGAPARDPNFFTGVPSPAGAMLVMLPMFVDFILADRSYAPSVAVAAYVVGIGFLMISRLPTYSFKNISIPREKVRFVILGAVLFAAALLTYLWATLVALCLIYCAGIPLAVRHARRLSPSRG